MSTDDKLMARRDAIMPLAIPRSSELAIERAKGATLFATDGKEYLDFVSGIGVMSVGHGRREVIDAVRTQMEKLQHVCVHIAAYEPYVALAERLAGLFPHGDATKVMLVNSGAEAVENAVKVARQATGRSAVIAYTGAFHGRTMMGMTLTSKTANKVGCGPYAPEVYRLPFPDLFRRGRGMDEPQFVACELASFEEALRDTVPGNQVAAVVIEAVQGEGGFNVAPFDYLRGLRRICDEHGILLVIDEVQSGFCRTGRWASYEHAGIVPDLSTWAKAMGGGLPIAAIVGRANVMDGAAPGTLGSTFGGNPVACAAALAAIQIMQDEDLCARALELGQRIRERLEELASTCRLVADVRGLGAMMAMELLHDSDPTRPSTEEVTRILAECRQRGLLMIKSGPHANVVRLLPPLTITHDELDRGLDILCAATLAEAKSVEAAL